VDDVTKPVKFAEHPKKKAVSGHRASIRMHFPAYTYGILACFDGENDKINRMADLEHQNRS
jgi:hypothetical protein